VNSSNYLYVSDSLNNRIQIITSNGTYVTQWGSYGLGNGQFYWPDGIAINSSDYVYVVDYLNSRIQVFFPNGTM